MYFRPDFDSHRKKKKKNRIILGKRELIVYLLENKTPDRDYEQCTTESRKNDVPTSTIIESDKAYNRHEMNYELDSAEKPRSNRFFATNSARRAVRVF